MPSPAQSVAERIVDNVNRVLLGKRAEIRLAVIGLLCQGHLLLEDVPGVGKTMMTKALARSVGAQFSRIQFTP
ncbi:MAG: AAA family ATPase, partial [Aggregatilineales bacterium]